MNFALRALLEVQETTLLAARAASRLFRRPTYVSEMIAQMDVIGVGSLTIILLTGFFTILRSTDDADYLINIIQGNEQAL